MIVDGTNISDQTKWQFRCFSKVDQKDDRRVISLSYRSHLPTIRLQDLMSGRQHCFRMTSVTQSLTRFSVVVERVSISVVWQISTYNFEHGFTEDHRSLPLSSHGLVTDTWTILTWTAMVENWFLLSPFFWPSMIWTVFFIGVFLLLILLKIIFETHVSSVQNNSPL